MFQNCDCGESLNLRPGLGEGQSTDPIWDEAEYCRGLIAAGFTPDGVSAPAHCAQYAPMRVPVFDDPQNSPRDFVGPVFVPPQSMPAPAPRQPVTSGPALLLPSQTDLDRAREMNRLRDEETERIRLQNQANEQSRFSQGFRPTFREGDWGQVRTTPAPAATPMPAPAAPAPVVAAPAPSTPGSGPTGGGMPPAPPAFDDFYYLPDWGGDGVVRPAVEPILETVAEARKGGGGLLALALLALPFFNR